MSFFPAAMKPIASSLLSQSFPPAPGGMNVAVPANEIDDTEAVYLQDILVDLPGIARRRGPVQAVGEITKVFPNPGTGLIITLDPMGSPRYALLQGSNSAAANFSMLAPSLAASNDFPWPFILPTTVPPNLVANGDFETNVAGWDSGVSSATVVRDTSKSETGTASLKATSSAAPFQNAQTAVGALTSGYQYTVSAWLWVPVGVTLRFGCFSATLGTDAINVVGNGAWQFATLSFTPTGTASDWYVFTDTGAAGAATTWWLDSVRLVVGNGSTGGSPYHIVDAHAALNAGTFVGTSSAYDANSPSQALAYWRGGYLPNTTAGTLSVTRGSATVTGSGTNWTSTVAPGMWVFSNTDDPYTLALIGSVRAIVSATQLTLENPSPYTATAKTFQIQSLRGLAPKVSVGAITTDVSSKTVNGGATKFLSQGLKTGSWDIYRASDSAWIGTVDNTSTLTDTTVTLKANAAISVADEAYEAIRADSDYNIVTTASTQKVGFLTGVYAQRQWYANNGAQYEKTYRLWFSDDADPENLDLTENGNFIDILSTGDVQEPILAIAPAYNALIVVKETETFGVFGTDPDTFEVRKLEDDGTLSGMATQSFGGGVLWAGRQGIHYYDGIQVNNLTEAKLGNVWKNTIITFDPSTYRMWSFMERNHYVLHIERLSPTIALVKGSVSTTPTHWTVVLNMDSGAVVLWQNVKHRGAITLPPAQQHESWYLINDGTRAQICSASSFFDAEGLDMVVEGVTNGGPDFYMESKKFDGGNPTRLKRFKYFILHYLSQGDAINVDTILGLNNLGETLSQNFPASVYTWSGLRLAVPTWTALKNVYATWSDVIQSVFVPARVRFLKKSQHLSFRLWQNNNTITRLKIGPFEIGYKEMRSGRV